MSSYVVFKKIKMMANLYTKLEVIDLKENGYTTKSN